MTDFTANWFDNYAEFWLKEFVWMREKSVVALEVGSYEGRSALWMMENLLTHEGSHLTCIDSWDGKDLSLGEKTVEAENRFRYNLATYIESGKVSVIKERSVRGLASLIKEGKRYGLIFVDASHEGLDALTDTLLAWEILEKDGVLIFDDYGWHGDDCRVQPQAAWDAFISMQPETARGGRLGRAIWTSKKVRK